MERLFIFLLTVYLSITNVLSQENVDRIISQVSENNTFLNALREKLQADILGNETGIYLENPELEFHYLKGDPSALGDRKDFSITQNFDFPTAYSYKKQISGIKNSQALIEYNKELKNLEYYVRLICIDLSYYNALISELEERHQHALGIEKAYKFKLGAGESNIMDYNKAGLSLLNAKNLLDKAGIEKNSLLMELKQLNGGIELEYIDKFYTRELIPADFETWFENAVSNNPAILNLNQEIELSRKQEKLNTAMTLPKMQLGYMSELIVGEEFRGVSFGLTVPIRENNNSVKFAKAQTLALESIEVDRRNQIQSHLKSLYLRTSELQKSTEDYRKKLTLYNNSEFLKKAFEKGEISLIDYILELTLYYSSLDNLLELERELNKSSAELYKYL